MEKCKKKIPKERPLQWHPANYAGLQIELAEEKEFLNFEDEHQLGTKPMAIDILIIKNETKHKIRKNIGRIFKKHNIVEYKSPDDYLSIDDFYKVYGYTCFYKADTPSTNTISIQDLTITFISHRYPQKLLRHLTMERNFKIQKIEKGIYYLLGDFIPIQFIVTSKLSSKENLWLKGLTNDLKDMNLTAALAEDYQKHRTNTLYQSVMDIIMRANKHQFEEAKNMCEAMREWIREEYADEIEEAKKKAGKSGFDTGFNSGLQDGTRRVNTLNQKLLELGRNEDILKSATNPEYQQQLFKEFGL